MSRRDDAVTAAAALAARVRREWREAHPGTRRPNPVDGADDVLARHVGAYTPDNWREYGRLARRTLGRLRDDDGG